MNTFVLILFSDHLLGTFDWISLQTIHSLEHPDQIPMLAGSGSTAKPTLHPEIKINLFLSSLLHIFKDKEQSTAFHANSFLLTKY